MKTRTQLTLHQKFFGAMLQDQVAFMRFFWKEELTKPPSTRQKLFWNDVSRKTLIATGRKIGKTEDVEARIFRKSLAYRRRKRLSERMFATPGDKQLVPVVSRLMTKMESQPLFKLMKDSWNKNDGILRFKTNVIWHMRIDGTAGDDRNMVGLRLDEILFDEAAFTIRLCHSSRKQSALPGCEWLYAGVPNSVRHTPFWELDQLPSKGRSWSHHKTSTYTNPIYWSEEERDRLREDYVPGSPDYTSQVMGCWGVELYSSFPLEMIAVGEQLPYRIAMIKPDDLPRDIGINPATQIRLMSKLVWPKVRAAQYVLGMDYGFLQDPTQLGIAYRESIETQEWKMLTRIECVGIDALTQAWLVNFVAQKLGYEKIGGVCIDLQHNGLAVSLELTKPGSDYPIHWWQQAIIDLNSNGIVEITDPRNELQKLKVRRKQYITQQLQAGLIAAKAHLSETFALWLGSDEDLVQELLDTREQKRESGYVVYIPRSASQHRPVDHCTDMLRAITAAARWAEDNTIGEVEGESGSVAAWAKNPFRKEWNAPWDPAKPSLPRIDSF